MTHKACITCWLSTYGKVCKWHQANFQIFWVGPGGKARPSWSPVFTESLAISTHGCVRSGHMNITVVSQQTTINPLSDTIWYHCKWQDPPSLPTTYFAIDQSPEAVKTWKITLRLGEIWSSLEVLQCQRISESSFICLPHFNTTKTYLTIPGVVDPSPTRTLAFAVCYK